MRPTRKSGFGCSKNFEQGYKGGGGRGRRMTSATSKERCWICAGEGTTTVGECPKCKGWGWVWSATGLPPQ
jgi:hypothetical protein